VEDHVHRATRLGSSRSLKLRVGIRPIAHLRVKFYCSRGLGDKAYDSAELREDLHERGTKSIIPNRCNRKQPFSFSKPIYKLRWRIESAINRLKDFRRIATRYDKLARNYLASVCLAAAFVWWI
jgi:putative transposase